MKTAQKPQVKKALFALGLALATMTASAANYYIVVPFKQKVSAPVAPNISVSLNSYDLPAGTVSLPYQGFDLNSLLVVTGDPAFASGQATWRVSSGAIPSGLSLSASGVISGTPTVAGTGNFTVEATYKTKTGAQTYQLVVANLTVGLNAATLPTGNVGESYSYDFKTLLSLAGDPNQDAALTTFALGSGSSLPPGLSLAANGVVSGTPSTKNTTGTNFEVVATYKTKSGQRGYTIVVNGAVLQVSAIASGGFHTCAVTPTGGVKCWGSDAQGQLGNDATLAGQQTPVQVAGLTSGVASISAGRYHTCAVTTSGAVKCWGSDAQGQLGNDAALSSQPTPVQVSGLSSGVASIAAGRYHTCALTTAGGVKCWGYDAQGELGNDAALANQPTPVDVQGLSAGVKRIAAGGYHTCAVTTAGELKCWGDDDYGQLGNDATILRQPTPVQVYGMASGVENAEGGDYHTCAIMTSGGLKCWGYDAQGQLGNDAALTNQPTPVQVSGLTSGVSAISLGGYHTCAVTTAGGLKCWGYDAQGQLGNDTAMVNQPTPVDVVGLTSGVVSVSAGEGHTCATTTAGHAKCWGAYSDGQLGNNTATSNQPTPVDVLP